VTLLLGLLFMARDNTRVINWTNSGFTLCSINQAKDSTVTFFAVVHDDFTGPPYPATGDTLFTIGDSTALESRWINALELPHKPGKEVPVIFRHKGVIEHSTIRTRANGPLLIGSIVVLQVLRMMIFLAFLALGSWAYLQRTESSGVRALALYCFSMATFTVTVFLPMYPQMASFQIPAEGILTGILRSIGIFFAAFWLLLQMLFPTRSPSLTRHPWLTYGRIFVPLALLVAYSWLLTFTDGLPGGAWLRWIFYGFVSAQTVTGFYLLRRNYLRADSNVAKRQTRLVLVGSGLPLFAFLIYLLDHFRLVNGGPNLPIAWRMVIIVVIFAIVFLSPISLAYAFGRYRLLEIEGKLRRGTRRFLLLAALFGAVVGIAYVGNLFIRDHFTQGSPVAVVVLSVVVIGVFRLAEVGKRALERKLYPERQRLREMVHDFLQHTSTIVDKRVFWSQLESRLQEGLMVDGVYPVLSGSHNGSFYLREKVMTPFHAESGLVQQLQAVQKPLMVDEAVGAGRVALHHEETEWLEKNRVALLLPLVAHGRLIGFLGLGHKTEREDYAAEELRILDSLAPQVALATDNMRLIEENMEKRRMEEELQMARRVQKGLLPKSLPTVPGLELATHTDFSLEVAGDYYDVICLEDDCTLLAVGDVAGKGAGAALLMSNLQASLRALVGADLPLTHLIARVNLLIYQNTEPEQFITFFVAIFDPRDRTLRYVNAGHNPPFLVRADGAVDYLDCGGVILGAFPDTQYEMGVVALDPGDVMVLYTDGISEAMNADEEEFGPERLSAATGSCARTTADQILHDILGQIALHSAGAHIEDDQTLLVAKVL
jgi:sigma-B regulation protein RsbU (phosphoserine phosphatase)